MHHWLKVLWLIRNLINMKVTRVVVILWTTIVAGCLNIIVHPTDLVYHQVLKDLRNIFYITYIKKCIKLNYFKLWLLAHSTFCLWRTLVNERMCHICSISLHFLDNCQDMEIGFRPSYCMLHFIFLDVIWMCLQNHNLTYLSLVPQICVGELGQHWFR